MAEANVARRPTDDRESVRFGKNYQRTADYHRRATELKHGILERRRALGQEYLRRHKDRDPGPVISQTTAFASLDYSRMPVVQEAVAESRRLIAARAGQTTRSKGSLDFFSSESDYDETSPTVQMLWSPEFLCPVIHYFDGVLPILGKIEVSRAPADKFLPKTTHMFHSDPDDVTQMKVFVHVTDVDEGCGPFHGLPADLSAQVNEKLGYPRSRLADEQIASVVGPDRALASIGPAGTTTFCDTTRCYHFGGRPALPGKPLRELIMPRYLLPTSTVYPLFEGDGEIAEKVSRLKPKANDPVWNAFIGTELVC